MPTEAPSQVLKCQPAKQETKPAKRQKKTYNKPVRTELLPDWFEEDRKQFYEKIKPVKDEEKMKELEEVLASLR